MNRDERRCTWCGRGDAVQAVSPRVRRCTVCGAVAPAAHRAIHASADLRPELARIAPGGLLRERYRLIEKLGHGAHGVSYYAEHRFLSHPCVVKILTARDAEASAEVQRLRREARAGFRVSHPNVVRVLDCDAIDGVWYFVMEYVEGANLADVLATGVLTPWRQGVEFALNATEGLGAIHRAGLAHRDIKPGNLILGLDGRVRVSDLGVAAFGDDDDAGRPRREAVGTPDYAAPEMFDPEEPHDHRADLYSLGATLFHLLTGRLPFGERGLFAALLDAQHGAPAWPADAPPDIPKWLTEAVLRLLAPQAADRFQSTDALLDFLRQPVAAPNEAVRTATFENLQPRGVAVLPFRNLGDDAGDDWLGVALAEYLSRGLARTPGVYVVDAQAFQNLFAQMPADGDATSQMRSAGRLAGAGTIVVGEYRRRGPQLQIVSRLVRSTDNSTPVVAEVEGPLASLVERQEALLAQLLAAIGAATTTSAVVHPPALRVQEKCALARQAYLRGEYEEAIRLAESAVDAEAETAEPLQYVGVCLARLGRYEEAGATHRRQEELARRRGDSRLLVEALANLGVMHYFRGEYAAALEFYERAAAMGESLRLTAELANIYNNLGFVQFRLRRPPDAERAFLRAIELHRGYGALASLVAPYNGMGNVLLEQARFDEAAGYYRRALALAEEIGDRTNVGMCYAHLGRCASLQGRYADAKHEFNMALNALEETRFLNGLAVTYEHIAEMHMQECNFEEAVRCADKRIELARLHANRRIEIAAWQQKADALRRAGRSSDAEAALAEANRAPAAAPVGRR